MSDCSICCEKFNLQNHKKITCSFCDFDTCRTCVQTYLLNSTEDPHCMKCKNAWNREFIDKSCTKTFRNKELKIHRENILMEREKSYLPETQDAAKRVKQQRSLRLLINQAQEEIEKQRHLIYNLTRNIDVLQRGQNLEEGSETKKVFIRKCPVDECKGFLSSQWKCEICENKICSKCNEIKENDHTCDPENVKTADLLKKDTKPCPKCGTLIYKSSGCAQMWCTSCHTPFNWNTGVIEQGIIHNPHFYDFQRNNANRDGGNANRNIGDIPCGGLPDIYELNAFFNKPAPRHIGRYRNGMAQMPVPQSATSEELMVFGIHRLINHLENYEFNYNLNERVLRTDNRDLRIRYLLNELGEEDFKKTIQQREKKVSKGRDLLQIMTMFSTTSSDMLRQLILKEITIGDFCENVERLKCYTNYQLVVIGKRYTSKIYNIDNEWNYL